MQRFLFFALFCATLLFLCCKNKEECVLNFSNQITLTDPVSGVESLTEFRVTWDDGSEETVFGQFSKVPADPYFRTEGVAVF